MAVELLVHQAPAGMVSTPKLLMMQTHEPDDAILRTLLYADVFDYPLTPAEIHYYLIASPAAAPAPPEVIEAALRSSAWLTTRVTRVNGYVTLRDREAIGAVRDERRRHSADLWAHARRWGYWLGCLPFVRLVAVTGALAVDNSPPGDDIDFLLVTAPGRVWLARALAVVLVRLARLRGVGLCPNYVLAHSALAQAQRNLYAAHDLQQMVPLVGQGVYREMQAANAWSREYLPHAHGPLRAEPEQPPRGWGARWQRWGATSSSTTPSRRPTARMPRPPALPTTCRRSLGHCCWRRSPRCAPPWRTRSARLPRSSAAPRSRPRSRC